MHLRIAIRSRCDANSSVFIWKPVVGPWGLLPRLQSRNKMQLPLGSFPFSYLFHQLKGLLFLEVPIRVLVPRGTGTIAATEGMSKLEPTQLFHVPVAQPANRQCVMHRQPASFSNQMLTGEVRVSDVLYRNMFSSISWEDMQEE